LLRKQRKTLGGYFILPHPVELFTLSLCKFRSIGHVFSLVGMGIEGSMPKLVKSFICRGWLNPVTSIGCTIVNIGASANLELVYKFCYLDDMLRVDGDADAAVEARIWIGWNKFRQLVTLLTNMYISLIMRGRLY